MGRNKGNEAVAEAEVIRCVTHVDFPSGRHGSCAGVGDKEPGHRPYVWTFSKLLWFVREPWLQVRRGRVRV